MKNIEPDFMTWRDITETEKEKWLTKNAKGLRFFTLFFLLWKGIFVLVCIAQVMQMIQSVLQEKYLDSVMLMLMLIVSFLAFWIFPGWIQSLLTRDAKAMNNDMVQVKKCYILQNTRQKYNQKRYKYFSDITEYDEFGNKHVVKRLQSSRYLYHSTKKGCVAYVYKFNHENGKSKKVVVPATN